MVHLEFLVEDSSGAKLLELLLPKIVGPHWDPHTWQIHSYKGIGRIPKNLGRQGDAAKRMLLQQMPRLLQGYGKTPGIDAVVVVIDSDRNDCVAFLEELRAVLAACDPAPRTLFRLAIEEIEAWYLGDRQALLAAYPKAKSEVLQRYDQDAVCGTWERLADAVHPGGSKAVLKSGWPLPGQLKHEWAEKIGPLLDPERNVSPSFGKLRDGLRKLAGISLHE